MFIYFLKLLPAFGESDKQLCYVVFMICKKWFSKVALY